MKLTRSRIPISENKIALATSQAKPKSRIQLESDPITQSQAGLFLPVFAILSGDEGSNILTFGEAITQAPAIGASRQAPNLIHLREVLSPHSKEKIAGQTSK